MKIPILEGICIVCYEAVCCKLFLDIFMKRKKQRRDVYPVIVLAATFLLFATITYYLQNYILRSLLIITAIVIVAGIFYSGKWFMKLFLGAVFYGLLCCTDYIGLVIAGELLDLTMLENTVIQMILVLLCKTIFFLLILFLKSIWHKRTDTSQMKNSEWILLFCFPILTVVSMLFLLFSYQMCNSAMGYLAVSFGMVIANIIMFILLQSVSEKEKEWHQIQMLQEQNKERIQAYRESNANHEFMRRIMHDYGNQLNCIQGLLQQKRYEQAQEYAKKLSENFREGLDVVNVKHPIINVLLNQKYHLAEEKDIAMIFQINDLSSLWMEEQDVVVLISNLLDNAIEACEKGDQKIIWVKMLLEKNQMVISVKNPLRAEVDIQDNLIESTKDDVKNHGIGLKNVQFVLKKYEAMGTMVCKDGYFWYTAVIPKM